MRSIERCNRTNRLSRWLWGASLLLGVGVMGTALRANAAETIVLRFQDGQVTVTRAEIEAFASSGQAEGDLGAFLEARPQLQNVAQDLLTRDISLGSSFREQLARPSGGSLADFVVLQLDKLVTSSTGQDTEAPVRTALLSALQGDDRFSLLELLQDFPESSVDLDLGEAEQVYTDVSAFVERIAPALETVRSLLQDLVCECNNPSAATASPTRTETPDSNTAPAEDNAPAGTSPAGTPPAGEVDSPSPQSDRQSQLPSDRSRNCASAAVPTAARLSN